MSNSLNKVITQDITLDISGQNRHVYTTAKQLDNLTRVINIHLVSNGEQYILDSTDGSKVYFRYQKHDGKSGQYISEITNEGYIKVVLSQQVLAVPGSVLADISIENGESVLSSVNFEIIVEPIPITENQLASDNEFLMLKEIKGGDWNTDDPNDGSFIKNRPFYKTKPIFDIWAEKVKISVDEYGQLSDLGAFIQHIQPKLPIKEGHQYKTIIYSADGKTVIGEYVSKGEKIDAGGQFIYKTGSYEEIDTDIKTPCYLLSIPGLGDEPANGYFAFNQQLSWFPLPFDGYITIGEYSSFVKKIPEDFLYQTDFEERNKDSISYIKNKPCGMVKQVAPVTVFETYKEGTCVNGYYNLEFTEPLFIGSEGSIEALVYKNNNVTASVWYNISGSLKVLHIGQEGETIAYIGNLSLIDSTFEDTKEPFLLATATISYEENNIDSYSCACFADNDESGGLTGTIHITIDQRDYYKPKKLDAKYSPRIYPYPGEKSLVIDYNSETSETYIGLNSKMLTNTSIYNSIFELNSIPLASFNNDYYESYATKLFKKYWVGESNFLNISKLYCLVPNYDQYKSNLKRGYVDHFPNALFTIYKDQTHDVMPRLFSVSDDYKLYMLSDNTMPRLLADFNNIDDDLSSANTNKKYLFCYPSVSIDQWNAKASVIDFIYLVNDTSEKKNKVNIDRILIQTNDFDSKDPDLKPVVAQHLTGEISVDFSTVNIIKCNYDFSIVPYCIYNKFNSVCISKSINTDEYFVYITDISDSAVADIIILGIIPANEYTNSSNFTIVNNGHNGLSLRYIFSDDGTLKERLVDLNMAGNGTGSPSKPVDGTDNRYKSNIYGYNYSDSYYITSNDNNECIIASNYGYPDRKIDLRVDDIKNAQLLYARIYSASKNGDLTFLSIYCDWSQNSITGANVNQYKLVYYTKKDNTEEYHNRLIDSSSIAYDASKRDGKLQPNEIYIHDDMLIGCSNTMDKRIICIPLKKDIDDIIKKI